MPYIQRNVLNNSIVYKLIKKQRYFILAKQNYKMKYYINYEIGSGLLMR
jgi:hypothetical protein